MTATATEIKDLGALPELTRGPVAAATLEDAERLRDAYGYKNVYWYAKNKTAYFTEKIT